MDLWIRTTAIQPLGLERHLPNPFSFADKHGCGFFRDIHYMSG